MSLDLINQANLLIEKTMNSTYKDDLRNLRNILNDDSFFSYHKFINCSSRFIRTPSQKYSDSLKVEIF